MYPVSLNCQKSAKLLHLHIKQMIFSKALHILSNVQNICKLSLGLVPLKGQLCTVSTPKSHNLKG